MVYLVFAIIILVIFKLPMVRGLSGEFGIRFWLKALDKDKYIVINNVMISSGGGKTAQIDHIVSIHGIFVIETKNYNGWIFGSESSYTWTQVIYKSKNQFYNPILQNEGHVKALQSLLADYPFIKYIPIVVFTSKADFKKLDVSSHVVYSFKLTRIIKNYTDINISVEDLDKIVQVIFLANEKNRHSSKEHIKRIQKNKLRYERAKNGICPWCGGHIVERTGKYGKFYGCSNFPKCKFILRNKRKL